MSTLSASKKAVEKLTGGEKKKHKTYRGLKL